LIREEACSHDDLESTGVIGLNPYEHLEKGLKGVESRE
jgi:hypothetical protein